MVRFSDRLREARRVRGLTQEQLAEMANTSRAMIGRYESTDQLPSLDTLLRIADALSVPTDYLLGRTEDIDVPYSAEFVLPPETKLRKGKLPENLRQLEALIREIVLEMFDEYSLRHD